MYRRRLNDVQKAVDKGKLDVNGSEISFIMNMHRKKKEEISEEISDENKEEINRLWCKI